MVKKSTPAKKGRLFGILKQMMGEPVTTRTKLGTDAENSVSNGERDKIIRRISEATSAPIKRRGSDSYTKYLKPIAKRITTSRLDAEAIEILAPEVKKAKEIVIPSIISPSDMRDGEIVFQSTSTLVTSAENERISKVLCEHFNVTEKLSRRLPEWLHEALYGAGSQPLLVLPITEIDTIISDPTAILMKTKSYATESINLSVEQHLQQEDRKSIFGVADSAHIDQKILMSEIRPAIESIIGDYTKTTTDARGETRPYDLTKLWTENTKTELNSFAQQAIEQIKIVDNPDVLKVDRARKTTKSAEITAKLVTIYKTKSLITINPETASSVGDPVVYELPPESVIPIFTPGTPTDHIGYFVLLDEYGNPLHMSADIAFSDMSDNRQVSPAALYKTFGLDNQQSIRSGPMRVEQMELMSNVYQTIVETHLKNRLKNSGLSNIYIGAPSSVYRCMFARYLALRQTRLLFVPKDLMTYICFKHNTDGTGRSKIEDIKFILSLKITVLICRVMATMNSSINRRKLTINFTDNMGDPVAFFQQIQKEAIDKSVMNFTSDPTEITRTLAARSLTISAKGIPGAENYDISSEPNEYRDIKPDDGLMDDLNNMLVLGLDVPPSAFNMLGENEFSRSIATNNLFFCRRIAAYQKLICELMASHAQTYTHMSETLKTKIKNILSPKETTSSTKVADVGTIEEVTPLDKKLADVIKHIIAVLPTPSIAPSKTEFEELDTIINSINTTIEAAFDNDLGSTDDANPMPMVRALIKESIVRDYMTKIGVMRDVSFPDVSDPAFLTRLHNRKLHIKNLIAGLQQANAVTTTQPTDVTSAGSTTPTEPASF